MKMALSLCDEQHREIVDEIAVELGYSRLKTEQIKVILETCTFSPSPLFDASLV